MKEGFSENVWLTYNVNYLRKTLGGFDWYIDHITILCTKANQKLNALARVCKYMALQKWFLFMSSYITSQFNYCPLVWMIHNKKSNKKINKIHERALRIVLSFSAFLKIDISVNMHQTNLQYLLMEICKVKKDISPTTMNEIFQFFENLVFVLRSGVHVPTRNSRYWIHDKPRSKIV